MPCANHMHLTLFSCCCAPAFVLPQVRLQEMRESVRIIYQCLNEMPNGLYKSPDNKVGGEQSCGPGSGTHQEGLHN